MVVNWCLHCDPVDWSRYHEGTPIDPIIVGGSFAYTFHVDPVYYGLFTISGSNSWPGGPDWPVGACIVI